MMIEEVIANLESYALWEYGGYKLSEAETECIINALHELKERREKDDPSKRSIKA